MSSLSASMDAVKPWSKRDLIDAFSTIGLKKGDIVIVHSSLRKLGPVEGGGEGVIDSLLELIGDEGTLAMPTLTASTVNGLQPVFHQKLTPSTVGVLTQLLMQREGAQRSLHPTHSVAALGARAEELVSGIPSGKSTPCPRSGPYGRLVDWGGKVLIIGETLNRCTLFHGCEEWAGVPSAYAQDAVTLYCIDAQGKTHRVQHHSHYLNTWDQYPNLEPGLIEQGHLHLGRIGDCPLRMLEARPASEWVVGQLKRDDSIILPKIIDT